MSIIGDSEFMEEALQEKLKDPTKELAKEIFQFLLPKAEVDITIILSALSMVLATAAVEANMEEEKAVYAFRKSYGNAKRKLKALLRKAK